jgi:ubiquinone/menaquinone biosynthesis C-methylase UbiE
MRRFRQKYYDLFSKVYDQFIAMHASGQEGALKSTLAEKTGASSGDYLLDICTGTGSLLPYLSEKVGDNGTVVGVDFSIGMLRAAKTKTAGCVNIHLVQADVARLPFKQNVFDAATCAHAFYELKGDSQDACLRGIRNILKNGKPFLMMEHDVLSPSPQIHPKTLPSKAPHFHRRKGARQKFLVPVIVLDSTVRVR